MVDSSTNGTVAYQVDWGYEECGRVMASSKRKIGWNFALAVPSTTNSGCHEVEHHQIEVHWSIASGKTIILFDGEEVKKDQKREYEPTYTTSFSFEGHSYEIRCHSAAPRPPPPDFRQYDLQVDECSFLDMKKITDFIGQDVPVKNERAESIDSQDTVSTLGSDTWSTRRSLSFGKLSWRSSSTRSHAPEEAKWKYYHEATAMV